MEVPTPGYQTGDVPTEGGCKIGLTNTRSFPDPDGTYYTQGDAVFTGGTCTLGDPPAEPEGTTKEPEAKPSDCIGGYQGEVLGMYYCAKPDPTSGVDWNGTSKTKGADGTETIKETKTTCIGDTCKTETKTTTKDANGNTTGTTTNTVTENKGTLCAREPGNGACPSSGTGTGSKGQTGSGSGGGGGNGQGGESSFAGNCASGFVAISDDAVTNAMAKEQHTRNCQLLNTEGEAQTEVNTEMQKDKTNVTGDNPNNEEVSMSNRIDTNDALGGGSCELNKELVIQGFTVTLPFNNLCGSLGMLGNLLVAVAMLLAGRIITRG
ncbi:hypothetical protein [Xenophilus sp. Marseille-Q4582]|uniref:hypothetical protein n=1 Tax=Xenophilus sp. Marseille-Q4582 TaxID=2866600 RepID=UPI001CE43F8F|nr:hypothetical protein [Xenophilus sp. Marseille-Q4582]